MECLQESIKCKLCFQLLEKPVVLPCGNVICQKHQHESQEKQSGIFCTVCDLNHEIPPNGGFVRIIPLENLIKQNIDHIDFGEEYQLAYEKLNSFSDLLKRFEQLKNDPEYAINAKISELKAEIDLRREELKNQIDEEALTFIKKLDDYEAECKENIPSIKAEIEKSDKLEEWKEDLDRWQQQMRTFKKDIEMWKKIYDEANRKYHQIDSHVLNLDYDIFLERFFEYQDLKHLIGCDRDMIKNHSFSYVVKNVRNHIKDDSIVDFYSDFVKSFGIDWCIHVFITSNKKEVSVNLISNVKSKHEKEIANVRFDAIILHQTDPSKSIKKSDQGTNGYGNGYLIELNEIMNCDGLYDAKNDCFTVQVQIKSVEFKNVKA